MQETIDNDPIRLAEEFARQNKKRGGFIKWKLEEGCYRVLSNSCENFDYLLNLSNV